MKVFHRIATVLSHVALTFFFIAYSIPTKIIGHIEREMEIITLPKLFGFRKLVLRLYVKWCGCRMEEAANPDLNSYRCMRDVFVRELKPGIRPIDKRAAIVCPCDNARVVMHGLLTAVPEKQGTPEERRLAAENEEEDEPGDHFIIQEILPPPSDKEAMEMGGRQKVNHLVRVKGIPYRVQEVIGLPPPEPDADKKLEAAVFHLAESELHHFSNPYHSFEVHYRIRIPGHVLPILPEKVRKRPYYLWSNERVVLLGTYLCNGERCFCAITFLAATAFVAHIKLDFEPELKMNQMADALTLSVPYLTGWRPPFAATRRTSRPYGLKRGSNCSVPVAGEPGSTPTRGLHVKEFHPPLHFENGQRLGHFASGSAVFMVWEAPKTFRLKQEAMTIGHPFPLGSPLTDVPGLQSGIDGDASAQDATGSSSIRSRRTSVASSSGGSGSAAAAAVTSR